MGNDKDARTFDFDRMLEKRLPEDVSDYIAKSCAFLSYDIFDNRNDIRDKIIKMGENLLGKYG